MNRKVIFVFVLGFLFALLSIPGYSASVFSCKGDQCVAKIEDGIVGDRVRILDEKASVISEGQIIRKTGVYAILKVKDTKKTIRKGYPVIINMETRGSNSQYAASFSSKD